MILAVLAHLFKIFIVIHTTYCPLKLSIVKNSTMKTLITKIILVFASVATLFGSSKKKEQAGMQNDAIRLSEFQQNDLVEDYEMAAYHNQA